MDFGKSNFCWWTFQQAMFDGTVAGNKLNDLQGTAPVGHIAELVQIARKKMEKTSGLLAFFRDKTTRFFSSMLE